MATGPAGRLTPDRFGFAMPVTNPPFDPPPYQYRDIEMLSFVYETDGEAAADIVPEGLVVADAPALATVSFPDFHFSTLGAYREAVLGVRCLWEQEPVLYCAALFVTDDIGELGGRDVYGFPKLLARIEWSREHNLIAAWVERPSGKRIVTGVLRPRDPLPLPLEEPLPNVTLKVIPSPEEDAPPEVAELVRTPSGFRVTTGPDGLPEGLSGPGGVTFDSPSALDPWAALPVRRMVSASWTRGTGTLGFGRVVKRYAPAPPAVCDAEGRPRPRAGGKGGPE